MKADEEDKKEANANTFSREKGFTEKDNRAIQDNIRKGDIFLLAQVFFFLKRKSVKKGLVTAILVISAIVMFTAVASVGAPPCTCGDICVNETGWWRDGGAFNASGTPIQDAVNNAHSGKTICVKDGMYIENVDVNVANLTIISENGYNSTIVQAASASDHVFEVTADFVNITGFTAKWATDYSKAGIYLDGVEHCEISDNKAANNHDGISLFSSSYNSLTGNNGGIFLESSCNNSLTNNTASNYDYGIWLISSSNNNSITNNTASNNSMRGIFLSYSDSNSLTNNTANSNYYFGIHLEFSSNCTLNNNTMSGNKYNFGVFGFSLSGYTQNIDTSNMVDGKPIYYWINQQDKQIPDDAGYVGVVNSTNITVKDLTLSHNNEGVLFVYTNNSRIENVSASYNEEGIYLRSSSNNSLTGNNASNNFKGIYLYSSSNNSLSNNTASGNHNGIYMTVSSNNSLSNNTVSNNDDSITLSFSSNNNSLTGNNASNNYKGIYLYSSSNNNTLTDNTANSNNVYGIHLEHSSNSTLNNNTMSGNTYNFGVYSYGLSGYIQNIDTNNTVDGKPVYYWINQQDKQIPDDAGYVWVVNSTNITVKDLTLSHNGRGVLFVHTTNSKIENVSASNNDHDGIYLESSCSNTLTNNTVSNNGEGIRLQSSSNNNSLTGNNASNNYKGILSYSSNNNTLTNNTANSNNYNGIYLQYSSNNSITSNNCSFNDDTGIHLYHASNNILHNNSVTGNSADGIQLAHWSNSNTLTDNTALNNTHSDFNSDETSRDNVIEYFTISQATISFIYEHGIKIKSVITPEPDPAGKVNISKYVHADSVTDESWIFLNVSYSNADVTNVVEDSLRLYHWTGTEWEEIVGSNVNTAENYVYANVTSFSQIAPFGNPISTPTPRPRGGGGEAPRDSDGDGISDIDEMLAGTDLNDPCEPNPECAACLAIRPQVPTPSPKVMPTPTPTATPTIPPTVAHSPSPTPSPTPKPGIPGFEAVFAIAGLLAVAYLALRRKQ